MNKQTKNQEEKRAAFRRFSKMGAAGLAVLSMSAFTDVSAQQVQDNLKNDSIKEQCEPVVMPIDTSFINDEDRWIRYGNGGGHSNYYTNNYCNYSNIINYSNSSNYSNTYGDTGYSNNYTNSM